MAPSASGMPNAKEILPFVSSPPLEDFAAAVGEYVPVQEEVCENAVVDGEDDIVMTGAEDVVDVVEHLGLPPHPSAMIFSSLMLMPLAVS